MDLYPQGFTILKVIRTSPFSVKASQYAMPSVYGRHYYYSDEDTSPQYTSIYAERDVKNENYICYKLKIRMDMVIFLQLKVIIVISIY